jgi:hypothetical protein
MRPLLCLLLLACAPTPKDDGLREGPAGDTGEGSAEGASDGGNSSDGGGEGGDGTGADGAGADGAGADGAGSDGAGADGAGADGAGADGAGTEGSDGAGADGTEDSGADGGSDGGTDGGSDPEPEPCPAGVICVDSLPYEDSNTTTGAARDEIDSYACASSTDESGPEVVYRVILEEEGLLALDLASVASGADIDVHLLESLDGADCIDRGHWSAAALVPAGTYYVVADTWVNSSGDEKDGSYTLTMGFISPAMLQDEGAELSFAEDALYAWSVAWANGDTDRLEYAITDFSMHSSEPRQWVLDLSSGEVLWNIHVAHGTGSADSSDSGWAVEFSNIEDSHQSSLGMVQGAETYTGTYGYSMRIDGLEPGYNDNVRDRAIVVHPWEGSRREYASRWGESAPTWGCPAIDDRITSDVVDTLSDGALLFFWYPDGDWSRNSDYLR